MLKKGDLTGMNYVMIGTISVIILSAGYYFFANTLASSDNGQLANLRLSMENSFKEYGTGFTGAPGSVKDVTFSVPAGVSSVCFVDNGKRNVFFDEVLEADIGEFPDRNVFISPFDKFEPLSVDFFDLDENPLCMQPKGSTLGLRLKSTGSGVKIQPLSQSDKATGCISLRYNRDINRAIDIVFLGSGYKDSSELAKDAQDYISEFLSVEPLKSEGELFNFFMADDNVECTIDNWISCDQFQASRIASRCPNDFIVVLVPRDRIRNVLNPVRSSAIANVLSLNTADNRMVMPHEFGHAFSGLADEYVDEEFYQSIRFRAAEYPNCDEENCAKWKGKRNTGCFEGCSLSSYFRPTSDSIMRSLRSKEFGPVNEDAIRSSLGEYK